MFDRTAIEATALRDGKSLIATNSRFGFELGRLVAALPRRWLRDVYSQLESLPDGLDKQQARLALTRLSKRALVSVTVPYDSASSWRANALVAKERRALEAIAVAGRGDPAGLPELWDYLDGLPLTNNALVAHTVSGFESVCRRLLEQTPRAVLVDPYFDISLPKHNTLFKAMVKWGQGGRCDDYDIYCRADEVLKGRTTLSQFESAAVRVFAEFTGVRRVRFRLFLLDDKRSAGSPMHRRLLVGEYGGVAIDYGFRIEEDRISDAVALSGEALEKFRVDYYDGKHGYLCRHVVRHEVR